MFKIRPLKRTFTLVFALVLLLALLVKYKHHHKLRAPQTPPFETTQINPSLTLKLPDNYVFRQDDPKWAAHTLGKTNDSLSQYGCTLTSVAMAVSNLLKKEITPADLNKSLTEVDGFTKSGLLKWKNINTISKGKLSAAMHTEPSHQAINQCMGTGGYPIIKIDKNKRITHWVVIVGKSNDDYFIRDPRIGKANDAPTPLSSRSKHIYAVRCVSLNTD